MLLYNSFTYFLKIPDWMSYYSEISESSSLGGGSLTVIITIPLIVSIYIIAIFAFISFFEKFCGKSKDRGLTNPLSHAIIIPRGEINEQDALHG